MKAVVVEIKGNVAAVLSDDGCVSKVKNRKYTLGQEIILKNNNKYIKLAASAAASLMLFVTPAWAYLTPYSYVSLDVNPSFEFSINRFDRVLQVKAINDDGQKIVEQVDVSGLKNMEIKEAVKNVITELKGQGYLTNAEESGMVVAASSKSQEKTDKLTASLKLVVEEEVKVKDVAEKETKEQDKQAEKKEKEAVKTEKENEKKEIEEQKEQGEQGEQEKDEKEALKANKEAEKKSKQAEKEQEKKEKKDKKSDFEIQVIEVSQDAVNKAKDKGVTPGKMNLVEKLQLSAEAAGESIDTEKWLDKPVKEIMDEIKKYEKLEKKSEKDNNKNNKENEKKSENSKENKSKNSKENKSDNNKKPR